MSHSHWHVVGTSLIVSIVLLLEPIPAIDSDPLVDDPLSVHVALLFDRLQLRFQFENASSNVNVILRVDEIIELLGLFEQESSLLQSRRRLLLAQSSDLTRLLVLILELVQDSGFSRIERFDSFFRSFTPNLQPPGVPSRVCGPWELFCEWFMAQSPWLHLIRVMLGSCTVL